MLLFEDILENTYSSKVIRPGLIHFACEDVDNLSKLG